MTVLLGFSGVYAAELSAPNMTMQPGTTASVIVSGTVAAESTFGVTILVELVPRAGNTGTVTFTTAPPVDVTQQGDPWPSLGTFTPFDTDTTGLDTQNGSVDDNGTFVAGPVTFSGALSSFPVTASMNATGVWDVVLSTTAGDSTWEGLTSTLLPGTITVILGQCQFDTDCNDNVACTDDTCVGGNCVFTPNNINCTNDGLFCNGSEVCDLLLGCTSTGDPCPIGSFCNETTDVCDQCRVNTDCIDGVFCTDDTCVNGSCVFTPNDLNCPSDNLFCNGTEICDAVQSCISTGNPCQATGQLCDEVNDVCAGCTTNADCNDGNICTDNVCNLGSCVTTNNTAPCDDGLFCTLTDVCSGGVCVGSGPTCPGQVCDETGNVCITTVASLSVVDLTMLPGGSDTLVVNGEISGFSTFGVDLLVELVPRGNNVGTVTFTPAPPVDIQQLADPWPGIGTFSAFDTDTTTSLLLNGTTDDNGTFIAAPVAFSGPLAGFPIVASADAGGLWDVLLSTSAGDSSWQGVTTTLVAGTIVVTPSVGLTVHSRAMPPGATVPLIVEGKVSGQSTFGLTVLVELIPRLGTTGTLIFTPAPPVDIIQITDPWPVVGTFSPFDTDVTGSFLLNGSVDDNGSFVPGPLTFSNDVAGYPLRASPDASGVWDVTLLTSAGQSKWEGLTTVLIDGAITVSAGACAINADCNDGNVCTTNLCVDGVCQTTSVVGACNDGDPCTVNDTCANNLCVGTPQDCTALDNACNLGVCNATTGICEALPANDGGLCDDGDPCTVTDTCLSGVCAGTAVDCTTLDSACTSGVCNATTGLCEALPINEAGPCDDTDLCTQNDVCTNGVCSGTGIDCAVPGDPCNIGSCDPLTGLCVLTPINFPLPCDDNSLCTSQDTCANGACIGTPIDCSALNDVCLVGTCDPAVGVCQATPANEGGICDDGDPCSASDVCTAGVCAGTLIPGCQACTIDANCNDGNVCTQNLCINSVCVTSNLSIACDDIDQCTTNDLCSGGVCAGTPVDCSPISDTCNTGVCNPATGGCILQPANDGAACDDGFVCTAGDTCSNGVCSGTLVGNPVVNLTLSPSASTVQVGQTFTIDLLAASGSCADQPVSSVDAIFLWNPAVMKLTGTAQGTLNWATAGFPDDSGLDGLNAPFTGLPDNDGDAVFQGVADFGNAVTVSATGSVAIRLQFQALSVASAAQVSLAPTSGLFTRTRVLGGGTSLGQDITGTLGSTAVTVIECQTNQDCNDGNVCTDEVCNASGFCTFTNNTGPCDDGLFCTTADQCSGGACVGGPAPCTGGMLCNETLNACVSCLISADCSDGNPCTDDICSVNGTCSHANNTAACDDGVFCTATDVCSGGACVGSGIACPAGLLCDEAGRQCVQCLGNADCNDNNLCTDDVCVQNVCQHNPNTLPCNDNLFCTTTDTCSNGACVGVNSPCTAPLVCDEATDSCVQCMRDSDCDDANVCTTDVCVLGICVITSNSLPCDDGLFCTATDQCVGGSCVGGGDPCPGFLCDETNDSCVECFTVADCADDGVACTVDQCLSGQCVHQPDNTACDDGLFCNGAEICNSVIGCVSPGSPCDGPTLCDETNNLCGCREPIAVAEGPRYIAITPQAGNTPIAIVVTGVDPNVACVSLYVQPDGTLGNTPVFKPPSGPDGWVNIHLHGDQITPSTSYVLQTECDTGGGMARSTPVQVKTWLWGDVNNSGGLVDIVDMTLVVDGFGGFFNQATLYNVDLWSGDPAICVPEQKINVLDMTRVVEAFEQFPFPCASPCP